MSETITVTGMSCEHCEESVEDALSAVPGVTSVEANNNQDSVTVEGTADTDDIVEAVREAGYNPEPANRG